MKTISFFASFAILLMFVSCQKYHTPEQESAKDPVFTGTIATDQTKTTLSGTTVSWVMGDEISITDSQAPAVTVKYIVSSIAEGVATFTKKEGEQGILSTGPYTATFGSVLSTSQTYTAEEGAQKVSDLPMSAATTDATSTNLQFAVTCGVFKITLKQSGMTIGSLAVTDGTDTYTLTCGTVVDITDGKTFYIAVPAKADFTCLEFTDKDGFKGAIAGISISADANHIKPVKSSDFAKPYPEASALIGYGTKIGSIWWAPVNCGYDATDYKCGKLYQWGRMDGCGYYNAAATIPESDAENKVNQTVQNLNGSSSYTISSPDASSFYTNPYYETNDWYTSSKESQLALWPMTKSEIPSGTSRIGNPCPGDWRVPTQDELGNLAFSDWSIESHSGTTSRFSSSTFDSTKGGHTVLSVFLPLAGYRFKGSTGGFYSRGSNGYYWSSSPSDNHARCLFLGDIVIYDDEEPYDEISRISQTAAMYANPRANGYSVRCVQK